MAFLSKLRGLRNRERNSTDCLFKQEPLTPLEFHGDVRVLIVRHKDVAGRRLVFDSKSVSEDNRKKGKVAKAKGAKVKDGDNPELTAVSEDGNSEEAYRRKYKMLRQQSDTEMLGEMMFGSEGLVHSSNGLKVHQIRTPPQLTQLMLSLVFSHGKPHNSESVSDLDSSDSLQGSYSDPVRIGMSPASDMGRPNVAQSLPVNVPVMASVTNYDDGLHITEDSGIASSVRSVASSSLTPSPSPANSSGVSSVNQGILKRLRYSRQTSLESVRRGCEGNGLEPVPVSKRPPKYGICAIFSMDENDAAAVQSFTNFFFSHMTLIEGHMKRLRRVVEKSVTPKSCTNLPALAEAVEVFRQSVCQLYSAPRVHPAVWLDAIGTHSHKTDVCRDFLADLTYLIDKHNSPTTKHFISSLVTAVLSCHLAWVATVMPAGASPRSPYLDKQTPRWLSDLARCHPYNPLWVQLTDLYGAVGYPMRLCRTVIVGKKRDLVRRLLAVLSYFIRCSDVVECPTDVRAPALAFATEDSLPSLEVSECPVDEISGTPFRLRASSESCTLRDAVSILRSRHSSGTAGGGSPGQFTEDAARRASKVKDDRKSSEDTCQKGSKNSGEKKSVVDDSAKMKPTNPITMTDGGLLQRLSDADVSCSLENVDSVSRSGFEAPDSDATVTGLGPDSDETATPRLRPNFFHRQFPTSDAAQPSASTNAGKAEEDVSKVADSAALHVDVTVTTQAGTVATAGAEQCNDKLAKTRPDASVAASEGGAVVCRQTSPEIERPKIVRVSLQGRDSTTCAWQEPTADISPPVVHVKDSVVARSDTVTTSTKPGLPSPTGSSEWKDSAVKITDQSSADPCRKSAGSSGPPSPSGVSERKKSEEKSEVKKSLLSVVDDLAAIGEEQDKDSKVKIWLNRGISQFDEYMNDDTLIIYDNHFAPEVKPNDDDVFDAYLDEPMDSLDALDDCRKLNSGDAAVITETNPPESGYFSHNERSRACVDLELNIPAEPATTYFDIPIVRCQSVDESGEGGGHSRGFGRSLLADMLPAYLPDFVLQGTSQQNTVNRIHEDLPATVQSSVLDDTIGEAVCILADTDKWTVQQISCSQQSADRTRKQDVSAAASVSSILTSVHDLCKLKMSPEFCLMHLEDRLQEVYFKSQLLASACATTAHRRMNDAQIAVMLGIDQSDLPLLRAVMSTYAVEMR